MSYDFKEYANVIDFEKDVMPYLLLHPLQNSAIISNIIKLKNAPFGYNNFHLVTVNNSDNTLIIGCQVFSTQMLFCFVDNRFDKKALNFFIDKILANKWLIEEVWSDSNSISAFAKYYSAKSGKKITINFLNIYRFEKTLDSPTADGKIKQCNDNDLNLIPYWKMAINYECGLIENDNKINYIEQSVAKQINNYFIWEVNNIAVCMASLEKLSEENLLIKNVYTPVSFRKNNYAYSLVFNICKQFKNSYKNIIIYTDADNIYANKCYKKVGFKIIYKTAKCTCQ